MTSNLKKASVLFFVIFILLSLTTQAQLPSDLSNVKAAQITDAQLQQFIQKAAESGMTEAQIQQEFTKRGLPVSEMSVLKARISSISPSAVSSSSSTGSNSTPTAIDRSRSYNQDIEKQQIQAKSQVPNSIFGSEFFIGSSSVFEPNLRIPTPTNYIIGPDDELLLDVSGVNISQQKLKVSPEGTIDVNYAGPTNVNGLSIEQALKRITQKLQQYYPSIASGQTKVTLSLGNIRTIKVILIGAVNKPGTFSLPSLATLYNALYQSGGPTANGSFRNIQLIRSNKLVVVADFYDFLTKGDLKGNVRLQDNDIIRVPFVETKISLTGEINRQGSFELKKNESLADAINYAGGFTANAFKARITGVSITDFDKKVIDIVKDSIELYKPKNGDVFQVGSIIEKFQNRVTIEGAVFKPGTYSLENGMTLTQLITKASGLKEDAYTKRIIVIRTKDDLTKEFITASYDASSSSTNTSLKLVKEDKIQISSIFDIKDQYTVMVNGAVRKPGTFIFEDSLSLKTLLLQAGGFADNATGKSLEISRRKRDVDPNNPSSNIAEIIKIDIEKELSKATTDYQLQPFDIISVKVDPNYKSQISVSIQGEVLIPGTFTLQSREERISSLIKRAGGTLYTANIGGARLKRKNDVTDFDLNVVKKIAASSAKDSSNITIDEEMKAYNEIAIDLPKILANPGSTEDFLLLEGDNIFIPLIDNMVSISGEVFKPLSVGYDERKSLKNYLNDAGGATKYGNKKRIFVIYPNGRANRTKHPFLIFKKYPEVIAGTKIFVPKDADKKPTDFAKTSIIVSAFSAMLTAFALIYQITK